MVIYYIFQDNIFIFIILDISPLFISIFYHLSTYLSIYLSVIYLYLVFWSLLALLGSNIWVTLVFVINQKCLDSGTREVLATVCLLVFNNRRSRIDLQMDSLVLVALLNTSNLNFSFTQLGLFALRYYCKKDRSNTCVILSLRLI